MSFNHVVPSYFLSLVQFFVSLSFYHHSATLILCDPFWLCPHAWLHLIFVTLLVAQVVAMAVHSAELCVGCKTRHFLGAWDGFCCCFTTNISVSWLKASLGSSTKRLVLIDDMPFNIIWGHPFQKGADHLLVIKKQKL